MKRPRDTQRARVYAAERTLPEFRTKDLGYAPSTDDMQRVVDKILADRFVRRDYGRRVIRATHSQGRGGACASGSTIRVSTYYRNRLIICHELAHCLTPGAAAHGWHFCAAYLVLVRRMMGGEVAARLAAAFTAGRVKFRKPRQKVPLSPEQRAALIARLAGYRLNRQQAAQVAEVTP